MEENLIKEVCALETCETVFYNKKNIKHKQKYCSHKCSIKARTGNLEYNKKLKELHNRKETKEKHSKAFKKRWEDKESRSTLLNSTWNDSTYRNNKICSLKKTWSDPLFKKKISDIHKEYMSTDEYKQKSSILQKEIQNRPDVKAKKSATMTEKWNDTSYAEKTISRGYAYKNFTLPSGKIAKLQGYEPWVLMDLLNIYEESDIVIGVKNIHEYIGHITYTFENKVSRYFPDFYIISEHLIIEVKSHWTYEKHLNRNLEKQKACLAKGINFKFIIK